ncbi:MAG TPA: L,D-transpeptidase [Pyrinomonadaceae bacterium]
MRRTLFITFLAGLIFFASFGGRQVAKSSGRHPESQQQRSSSETQSAQPDRKPLILPLENPRIMVHKAARKLELYSGEALLRTYRIGLGFSPVADKKQEGDGATPEGDFYVFVKNNRSAYYLSLGVSYPNVEDAERGLRDGLINRSQYNAIVRATKNETAPPQYTKLGGLIYIHGHGARSDWTWGCVALENEDIKELFDAVGVGTQVTILP